MMQPRHWLDRQHALNSSGLRELTGRRAPELAKPIRTSKNRPAIGRTRTASARKLWFTRAHALGKKGAVQVPGLGLKMRDLAAYQDAEYQDTG